MQPPTRADLEARVAALTAALDAERARNAALTAALDGARRAAAELQSKVRMGGMGGDDGDAARGAPAARPPSSLPAQAHAGACCTV